MNSRNTNFSLTPTFPLEEIVLGLDFSDKKKEEFDQAVAMPDHMIKFDVFLEQNVKRGE